MDEQLKNLRQALDDSIFSEPKFTVRDKMIVHNRLQVNQKKRFFIPKLVVALVLFISFGLIYFYMNQGNQLTTGNEPYYIAKESDLEDNILVGRIDQHNKLEFFKGKLKVIEDPILNNYKPGMNPEKEKEILSQKRIEMEIDNIKITTKGNTFYITGEGEFYMELVKVAPRIFMDSNGNEFMSSRPIE
ncbi:hypothetical protein [Ureibacillus manganicus]|uniref:Uncharacterized protein n=1 Tax=Ureibacillus manganicus DSM 26584 TaxID=1384049 RepID=A0A0A3IAH6_9BACL|nr:hypothetical protein [Ureibacillus manganicus]KGR80485.1 hypothetical protein CD29_00915 [Ureibacillus manganicus DSM 26584]